MDREGVVRLLAVILDDLPRLPGTACIEKHDLFDPMPGNGGRVHWERESTRIARAARVCVGCPARAQCTTVTTGLAVGTRVSTARVRRATPPPAA